MTHNGQDYSGAAMSDEMLRGEIKKMGLLFVADMGLPVERLRAACRVGAIERIDLLHASFMRSLTGDATVEERDTWKPKEEAARAYVDGSASDGQKAMIDLEAAGTGGDPVALAARVVAKAEAFLILIGIAAGLRAKARAAIIPVTADNVPLEGIADALDQVFAQIDAEVQEAITQWEASLAPG